jgi:hypothetical protein
MQSSISSDNYNEDLIIDPALTSQEVLVIDPALTSQEDNPNDSHSSVNFNPNKKRKSESWIFEHGSLERIGQKKHWKCHHCKSPTVPHNSISYVLYNR